MDREALFYLPSYAPDITNLFKQSNFNPNWRITENDLSDIFANTVECVILDHYQTQYDELMRWKEIAPVIGIDEGGKCRDTFDFLVDILIPHKLISTFANITEPSLLKFPPKPPAKPLPEGEPLKVLVSFGQEDIIGLGHKITRALSAMNDSNIRITWIKGGLGKKEKMEEELPNVTILDVIPNLAESLWEYDLVITHYGITAYEALYMGTSVLLASPTPYHKKLAKAAGFKLIRVKKPHIDLRHIFSPGYEFTEKLRAYCKELAIKHKLEPQTEETPVSNPAKQKSALAALVNSYSPMVNRICPVCGEAAPDHSAERFKDRTYRRCKRCGVIYMDRTSPPPIQYEKEYFFDLYKTQYGKTYLEDFPNLTLMAKSRLEIIKGIGSGERGTLLDIGCAYGPFLAAAREEGFIPFGIDPVEDAVQYIRKELDITAVRGFFPNCPLPSNEPYDVITLWYVIEHFNDCYSAFKEISKILKPGGILAFSTPSISGISGRSSHKNFLFKSPADHFTVWSPRMCKKALSLSGFKVKKIVSTGHHPERFPFWGKLAKGKKSLLYWPLLGISKLFGLGDTFEVYAVNNK
jgi:2-polyprenyl-3-methyl-5-hydroxy-6-metoxy-1,4-benzoquinol methylase